MEREHPSPAELLDERLRQARSALVWSPSVRGTLCHQLIATLCATRRWAAGDIEDAALALLPRALSPTHVASLLGFLVPAASSFKRHFDRKGWRFAGAEVVIGDVALDLLWERGGRLEADEVKSGADAGPGWRLRAGCQAAAQRDAARGEFGSAFTGVRVTPVLYPPAAFWVPA